MGSMNDRKDRKPNRIAGVRSLLAGLALAGVAATAGCFSDDITPPEDSVAAEVDVRNFEFVEDTVFIDVGETVRWTLTEGDHTVTADPALANDPASVELPQGASTFDSGLMSAGETFEHTFDVAGTYKYFCQPHELIGMVGWVIVQ